MQKLFSKFRYMCLLAKNGQIKYLLGTILSEILPSRWLYRLRVLNHSRRVRQFMQFMKNNSMIGYLDQTKVFYFNEWKVCSQFGDDGVLLYIFSKIGVTNRRFVEFGVQDGRQCNTANLSINCGWSGLLMEGNPSDAARAIEYYSSRSEIKPGQVTVIQSFITAENINDLISSNGVNGKIDLLSIDIDGNDYWVWKAITCILPRVVVIEYNATLGTEKSLTIPYDPKFMRNGTPEDNNSWFFGATLRAMTKLATEKGYVLVGCISNGGNAYFIQKDLCCDGLRSLSVEEAYYPSFWMKIRNTTCKKAVEYQEV
jgi:hypothetical protein